MVRKDDQTMNMNIWYAQTKELMQKKHTTLLQLMRYAYHRQRADRLADGIEENSRDEEEDEEPVIAIPADELEGFSDDAEEDEE